MKKQTTTAIVIALLAVFVTSCNKEKADVTKPIIDLQSPADGDTLVAGSDHGIHFAMELSDDVELASYKVNIHNADDGHEHKSENTNQQEYETFEFNQVWDDIAGKRNASVHHHEIVIPANAKHGKYHLVVYCTDAEGNEAHVVRNVVIDDSNEHEHEH